MVPESATYVNFSWKVATLGTPWQNKVHKSCIFFKETCIYFIIFQNVEVFEIVAASFKVF